MIYISLHARVSKSKWEQLSIQIKQTGTGEGVQIGFMLVETISTKHYWHSWTWLCKRGWHMESLRACLRTGGEWQRGLSEMGVGIWLKQTEAEWAKINRTQETTWTVQPFGQSHSIIISASPMLLFFLLANRDVGMRSSVSNPSFLLSA